MDDFQHLDDYALLGVAAGASRDEIKQAYRREIAKYHPDRYRTADPQTQQYARERSQRLTEAYAGLSRGPASRSTASFRMPAAAGGRQTAAAVGAERVAALYQEAQSLLAAGQAAAAVRLLQQIQRVDPFYRDVDELLARAEALAQGGGQRARRPLLWIAGGALGVLVLLGGVWSSGVLTPTAAESPPSAPAVVAEASLAASAAPSASAAVVVASPSAAASVVEAASPSVAPEAAASAPAASAAASVPAEPSAPPTETIPSPTTEPTPAPPPPTEIVPTATVPPAPQPTAVAVVPPAQPPAAPTRRPAVGLEGGQVLVADAFGDAGSGWAQLQTDQYTMGYRNGAYAITTNPGTGSIFSFGAPLGQANLVLGADVTPVRGFAGLLFGPDNSYRFFVSGDGRYRVEQRGREIVPTTPSRALRAGTNRLVVAAVGRRASLYANGTLLANLDLPSSLDGTTYGFVVQAGSRGGEGIFDSLTVRALPR